MKKLFEYLMYHLWKLTHRNKSTPLLIKNKNIICFDWISKDEFNIMKELHIQFLNEMKLKSLDAYAWIDQKHGFLSVQYGGCEVHAQIPEYSDIEYIKSRSIKTLSYELAKKNILVNSVE